MTPKAASPAAAAVVALALLGSLSPTTSFVPAASRGQVRKTHAPKSVPLTHAGVWATSVVDAYKADAQRRPLLVRCHALHSRAAYIGRALLRLCENSKNLYSVIKSRKGNPAVYI